MSTLCPQFGGTVNRSTDGNPRALRALQRSLDADDVSLKCIPPVDAADGDDYNGYPYEYFYTFFAYSPVRSESLLAVEICQFSAERRFGEFVLIFQ